MTSHVIPEAAPMTVEYSWGTYHETATKIWITTKEGAWK